MIVTDEAEVRRPMSTEERKQMLVALEHLKDAGERLLVLYPGIEWPPAYEVINEMRDARTRQLMGEEE